MAPGNFPGGLSELEFVESYCYSAVRKPRAAAESALRTLVFAETSERPLLAGLIVQELTEAALRLVAVHDALSERRYSIGRALLRPLPGAPEWERFVQCAATMTPEQMVWDLSLSDEALPAARTLRAQHNLADFSGLISAAAARNAMVLVPPGNGHGTPECWFAGVAQDGTGVATSFKANEHEAVRLADLTCDLSDIAHGFLHAYVGSRRSAGRRDWEE